MICHIVIGEYKQTTAWDLKRSEHYELYINTNDMDYDGDDSIITGYIYKIRAPEINKVNGSEYGKRMDFKQDFVEVICNNFYVPTSVVL